MLWLLAGGILLRLMVMWVAGPFNPDLHFQVIQYVAEHHALPISNQLSQSYHPPLYYILMAGLYGAWPDLRVIHFASFVFSAANLWLILVALERFGLVRDAGARVLAFAFACVLPQFVMFGSFISNDSLTLLVGTLVWIAAARYLEFRDSRRLLWLAIINGLALLTKGTFLLTAPALVILVLWVERGKRGWRRALLRTASFCLLVGVLGCYKYVENFHYFGRFIVHNLDAGGDFLVMQRGVWKGPQTIYDINVLKLIRRPILQIHNTFSYPLLMYGTFWYPHIPDSTFRASVFGYEWVGSLIYAAAIVPTILFLYGLARGVAECVRRSPRCGLIAMSGLLLLSNLAVVLAAGVKYDAWSCFQSRLCFQSMVPILGFFGLGFEAVASRRAVRATISTICWIAVACCVLYFIVEIAFAWQLLPPGQELQP